MKLKPILDAFERAPAAAELASRLPLRGSTLRLGGLPGSSGAVLAAWRKALAQGLVASEERVLLFNCANGNKYPLPDRSGRLTLASADPAKLSNPINA